MHRFLEISPPCGSLNVRIFCGALICARFLRYSHSSSKDFVKMSAGIHSDSSTQFRKTTVLVQPALHMRTSEKMGGSPNLMDSFYDFPFQGIYTKNKQSCVVRIIHSAHSSLRCLHQKVQPDDKRSADLFRTRAFRSTLFKLMKRMLEMKINNKNRSI